MNKKSGRKPKLRMYVENMCKERGIENASGWIFRKINIVLDEKGRILRSPRIGFFNRPEYQLFMKIQMLASKTRRTSLDKASISRRAHMFKAAMRKPTQFLEQLKGGRLWNGNKVVVKKTNSTKSLEKIKISKSC